MTSAPAGPTVAETGAALARAEHAAAAQLLATEALLRCWVRETQTARPPGGTLKLDLGRVTVRVPVEYWSATGLHRFGTPRDEHGPLTADALARLLGPAAQAEPAALDRLVRRTADSADRIAAHLSARTAQPNPNAPATPFLAGEQSLPAGHPLHPTPKSRDGLTAQEAARYSPELRGSFPLHWFAVDAGLVAHESELGPAAPELAASISGLTTPGRVAVPAHPWQAAELLRRTGVRKLIGEGRLDHLGPAGPHWNPTSSLRTVYRPDVAVMLKLSLGLRITDSRRENRRRELLRGVEAHRMLSGVLGSKLLGAHPTFRVLTDPAYLAVDGVPGLDVAFRHAPFRATDYVYCVAALTDLGRGPGSPDGHPHELAAHLHDLAANERRSVWAVTVEWFVRYVGNLIVPLLWLDAEHGVALEGHQQNTLIQLDARGYPSTGWYRGNQGFSYRESRVAELEALTGLANLGKASESTAPDERVSERLVYCVGIDNLMGMVGSLGGAGLAEEEELLAVARDLLAPLRGHHPVDLLLGAPTLRCKANLLSRVADLGELSGPPAARPPYVEMRNPLAAAGAAP